jgi:heat shock protein HslJ
VYFYQHGQAWQAHGVPFAGYRNACPDLTTTYYLRVVRHSGWIDIRRLVIHVVQPSDLPQITRFTVEPMYISVGGCVTARWEVRGQDARVRLLRDGAVRWDSAPLIGNLYDCPTGTAQALYVLEATGSGGTTSMQRFVYIDATPIPTPVPLSGTSWQVLAIGNSVPVGLPVTAHFGQQDAHGRGTLSGWGSCNSYSALYQQSGASLSIGSSTTGDNACTPEMVAQEQAMLNALHATASFSRSGGQLVLRDSLGQVVLNLTAISASPFE